MLRFIAVFLGIACLAGCAGAPVQEMSDARQAIVAARAAGATEAISRAERLLRAQEYTRARLAALQAKSHAGVALVTAQRGDDGSARSATPDAAATGSMPPPHQPR
jgi:hypothetical protein